MFQKIFCQQQNFSNIMTDYSNFVTDLLNLMINHENFNSHLIHYFCCICIVAHYLILYYYQETHFLMIYSKMKISFFQLFNFVSSAQFI